MIVIPNEKLLAVAKDAGFFESFRIADDVLRQGVQGISDIITIPGVINRDFADVKTTMAGMGYAVMGTAMRSGTNRATEAAMAAMASPLLESGAIDGAKGILINITGSSNLKLSEVNEASSIIQGAAHEDANIIFGAVQDEGMGDDLKITVIATGFRQQEMPERRERMLAETTMPGSRYDVPIAPRVQTTRYVQTHQSAAPATDSFVASTRSERMADRAAMADRQTELREQAPLPHASIDVMRSEPQQAREPVSVAETQSRGEGARESVVQTVAMAATAAAAAPVRATADANLVPVRASVFDDEFFRSRSAGSEGLERRGWEAQDFSTSRHVQQETVRPEVFHVQAAPAPEPGAAASFGSGEAGAAEPDELDIPAFLRRGN